MFLINLKPLPAGRVKVLRQATIFTLVLFLIGCSGGSGGGASDRAAPLGEAAPTAFVYEGPPPASDEIQEFKIAFYDNLVLGTRCGDCHTTGGPGPTLFVDNDNVNTAWQEALSVVNLEDPAASQVVERVANGHNCWLGAVQSATCATTVIGYIERWAQGATQSAEAIQLSPRAIVLPSGTKTVPPLPEDFESSELYSLLYSPGPGSVGVLYLTHEYCSACHSDTANVPQSPFFASENPAIAYEAMRSKVNLNTPADSRLVLRLRNDFHNCWDDCVANAQQMEDAISRFANAIEVTEVDSDLLFSLAQVLDDHGIIASVGGRFETDLVAKWEFREGVGTTIADTSGVQPEAPLTLVGDYTWLGGWGVVFRNAKAQAAVSGSAKMLERMTATGEYTIEAWVAPNNVTQENSWIVGYAGGALSRNFLMTQNLYDYDFYNRSSATDTNGAGDPALSTDDDAEIAQATLQHVVMTFDPVNGRRIYVNGEFTGDEDSEGGGTLNSWNESFSLVLGNSIGQDDPWAGVMRMVAIHNRVLTDEQIAKNFEIGVGEKYFLLFSVSEILDREGECHDIDAGTDERTNYCYVVFEVSQFDSSSYLFNKPFFISLNQNFNPDGFEIQGIRIGINGKLAETGQGFANVNAIVDSANYISEGQPLSDIGSILALENGSSQDSFFLAFDQIDGQEDATTPEATGSYDLVLNGEISSDIGFRTFEEISQTFSNITQVPINNSGVATTFENVKRAMPSIPDFQAYLSSHQMAVTQLAIVYCDAMVDSTNFRDTLFPTAAGPIFGQRADTITDSAWQAHIFTPLGDSALATGLTNTQPSSNAVQAELLSLVTAEVDLKPYVFNTNSNSYISTPDGDWDGLARCGLGGACPQGRTEEVVKAVCAAVLGSSAVILQ